METIEEIQEYLRRLYKHGRENEFHEVALPYRAAIYAQYAEDYRRAAGVIRDSEQELHHLSMPWYQLIGQSVELAMKACLAAAGISPPRIHDLVELCKQVEAAGFSLGVEHAHAHLVHLNHGYFEDLATGDRFVARYGGGGSWAVPDHNRLSMMCSELLRQAKASNPLFRDRVPFEAT